MIVHGHLCKDGRSPLELMGSEVDVLKLCSSLELFLKVAREAEDAFRRVAAEILRRLG